MSESQQASHHASPPPVQNKNLILSDLHSIQHGKINIGRSNSAPQSQGKFVPGKMRSNERLTSNCSEGVNRVYPNGKPKTGINTLIESPKQIEQPSCESKSEPAAKCCSPEESCTMREHPGQADVWQRRADFISSGHSQDIDSASVPVGEEKQRSHPCVKNSSSAHSATLVRLNNGSTDLVNGSKQESQTFTGNQTRSQSELVDSDVRRHPHRYPFRQAQSEVILPTETQRRLSLAHVKEVGYARLEEELMKAQKALEQKDEEVDELKGIRERLMKEVSDFTASLFEEVNSQLNTAALSEQQARKQLQEANTKIEVLSAEVAALKDLVLTSTPSSPNRHLHPQIDSPKKEKGGKPFWKTHRRSTSHHQFTKESREKEEASQHHAHLKEMDTVVFDEFSRWRLQPTIEFTGQFFTRVQVEDIQPCLNFKNVRLANRLLESVKNNSLSIEPIPGDHSYPRKCCLSETSKLCNYKIKFEGEDEWYSISQMARNRIAAVCDFFSYVRYIAQGLVKCSDKDMYAELVKLRGQMAEARLGLI